MKRRNGTFTAGAALGAAGWLALRRAHERRLAADPDRAQLTGPLEGRPVAVRSADGTRLHAEVFGPEHAPTIVLIHGWTCAIRFWTHQIRDLAGDYRVVAYDHRGHGRSEPPSPRDYTIERFGEDLQAVLEQAVPPGERALVAGHSLGGMTIVGWAGTHSEEVRRRVAAAALINTGMGDLLSEALLAPVPRSFESVRKVALRQVLRTALPLPRQGAPLTALATRYIALSPGASPAAVALTQEMVLDCPPGARAGCATSLADLDLYAAIEHLDVPTLVIAGAGDKLTPPPHATRLADTLPQLVELVEIPGSGHMSPLEAPAQVTTRLRELAARELSPAPAGVADTA